MQHEITVDNLPSRRFQPRIYGVGAWTSHLHFACDLVALTRPRVLVELGTDRGESYFAFCQSVVDSKTGTRCFAIDTWQGDTQAGAYDETTFAQVSAHNRAHYETFSTLLRRTFDAALATFPEASIDLLHLDGLHSEEAVRHDLSAWLSKLRPGGLLLLHDVNVRDRDFGVWKVWEELRRQGRSWTCNIGPGLGLWQKVPNELLPQPIEALFLTNEQSRGELEAYYEKCAGELRQQIAQEWRDGTVRHLPFLQQTIIQIFHTRDGIHREEDSMNRRIGHGDWKDVTIALPAHAGASPLRIDFVSPWTVIEIAELRLVAGQEICFEAKTADDFNRLVLAGDLRRLPSAQSLKIEITGLDPQLYLPVLATTSKAFVLTLRVKVQPS